MESLWCEGLRKKYPQLLGGISMMECAQGWEKLLDEMCSTIVKYESFAANETGYTPLRFVQIKEKFGSLRAYTDGGFFSDESRSQQKQQNIQRAIHHTVDYFEGLSVYVCSCCGAVSEPSLKRGLLTNYCDDCRRKWKSMR